MINDNACPADSDRAISTGGGGPRVLVIEDNAILGAELCALCCEVGATPVGPLTSLQAVTRELERGPFSAATVDINLGDGSDFQVSDRLADAGIPFIYVSGYGRDTVDARHAGIPFLQKPAPIQELKDWLFSAIASVSGEAPARA